jgi:hypothetical protein
VQPGPEKKRCLRELTAFLARRIADKFGRVPVARKYLFASAIVALTACSSDPDRPDAYDSGSPAESDGGDDSGTVDPIDGASSTGDAAERSLTIDLTGGTLEVDGSPATLTVGVLLDGQPLSGAGFAVDDVRLGSIDQNGVFSTDGKIGGTVTITVRYGDLTSSATLTIVVKRSERDPAVSAPQVTALDQGGDADAAYRVLYPYDHTVWPRGLAAPLFQFGGAPADVYKISLEVEGFSYTGYHVASAPGQLALPQDVWDGLTQSADGASEVTASITKLSGTAVTGPTVQRWRVAPADLKGVIYYNTYRSASTNTGAVMRIRPGEDAEVMLDGCTVCHSVSAQGNTLATGKGWSSPDPVDSVAFDLRADGSTAPLSTDTDGRRYPFAALTPDGTWMVTNGVPDAPIRTRGMNGPLPSALVDSASGAVIDAPSLTQKVSYALTPAFSPDGTQLAFNDFDRGAGTTLATMGVDLTTSPPSFGDVTPLVSVSRGVVAWPSFFPDASGLLYHEGDRLDTVGWGPVPAYAEIRLASLGDGTSKELPALNGYNADGSSYLPYGDDEENRRNYEPSVLPVPVGGYYWVLFTSRRAYGNTLAPGGSVPGTDNEWGTMVGSVETPSLRKKLWLAAIDLDYAGKDDPSHPAIYLPGQELLAGNMRAYASLEPCRDEGTDCASGADCCSGFCRPLDVDLSDPDAKPVYQCVAPPGGCANVDEGCDSAADCCNATDGVTCINHRCASPNLPLR